MKYFNPQIKTLDYILRKRNCVGLLVFIAIISLGCNGRDSTNNAFVFEQYTVRIIANDLGKENHKSVDIITPLFIDSIVFLPDNNSEYLELTCHTQNRISIYMENPCTGTQITFNTCDSATIYRGVQAQRDKLVSDIDNLSRIKSCNKEKINENIKKVVEEWYEYHPDGSIFVYGDPSLNKITSMIRWPSHLIDNNTIAFVSSIDSLRIKMAKVLESSKQSQILIIYNPPKASGTLFGVDEKGIIKGKKAQGVPGKSEKDKNEESQKEVPIPVAPLRIDFSEDRTKFQWSRPNSKATFKALIYDFGNPSKVFGSYDMDSDNEMYLPSGLALNHSYVFQIEAYKGSRKMSCRKIKFSLNNRMLIDPTCKDNDEKCN